MNGSVWESSTWLVREDFAIRIRSDFFSLLNFELKRMNFLNYRLLSHGQRLIWEELHSIQIHLRISLEGTKKTHFSFKKTFFPPTSEKKAKETENLHHNAERLSVELDGNLGVDRGGRWEANKKIQTAMALDREENFVLKTLGKALRKWLREREGETAAHL